MEMVDFYYNVLAARKRYTIIKGGRGAGKSWAVADWLLCEALDRKVRILCTREIQRTIRESVLKLLTDRIETNKLSNFFIVQRDKITSINGSEFIFAGLWQNTTEIKSMEGVDICWVEEAQRISDFSLDILTPTIRKKNSYIIFTYNPYSENDAVFKKFVNVKRDDVEVLHTTIFNLPERMRSLVLLKELEWDKETNEALYRHKWIGEFYEMQEGQIFAGKFEFVNEIPDRFDYLCYGLDFGYAEDPNVLVKIGVEKDNLYILEEKVGYKVEIRDMKDFLGIIKGTIIADSARPEIISYLKNAGYNIIPCRKQANSILEGIDRIKAFRKVYIAKDCEYTYSEFQTYCWKTDKITNKIIPIPIDRNNHAIDAIRYALQMYRKSKSRIEVGII